MSTAFSLARRYLGKLLPAGLLGLFFTAGVLTASAQGAVFNGTAQDAPALQVAHLGDTTYRRTATANPGDTLQLLVWVHNSVEKTTAVNTRVKVEIPTQESGSHTVTTRIWADQVQPVTGQVSIATSTPTHLSYVPGSATLMKVRDVRDAQGNLIKREFYDASFPGGQSGNEIVAENGVWLGNIEGCWQFMQAIRLQVKVEGPQNPAINTNKKVALAGINTFGDEVTANPNDAVEYKIFFENTGQGTGRQPQIIDVLDERLNYIEGSSLLRVKQNNQDFDQPIPENVIRKEKLADGKTRLTWQFVDMEARPSAAIYLRFQAEVAPKDKFPVGQTVIPNKANASFAGGLNADTNTVYVKVNRSEDQVFTFKISKLIQNVTNKDKDWKDERLSVASPGDTVAFMLNVQNTGNTAATDVYVKDILPQGLTFLPGHSRLITVPGDTVGTEIDGSQLFANGYKIAKLDTGTKNVHTFIFWAKLTGTCEGEQTLRNLGQVIWKGKVVAEDDASAIFACTKGLTITKMVHGEGSSEFKADAGIVREGETLTYRINVFNNGNTEIIRPVLKDVLPPYVEFVPNSLFIDGERMSQAVQDRFRNPNAGMILTDNFGAAKTKEITFQVKVVDCPEFGDTELINTAIISADGVQEKRATAKATVRVTKPVLSF